SHSVKSHLSSASLHVSTLHSFPSSQTSGVPAQMPPEQTSLVVQNAPSSHGSLLSGCVQTPPSQTSSVQTCPSSGHGVPLSAGVSAGQSGELPVHRSSASQTPDAARQIVVDGAFGNTQPNPSAFGLLGSHTSLVQICPSSHSASLAHCGTARVVSTCSQLHFDFVPGSAWASSGQSVLLACWRHVEHVLTSKNPSPLVSAHTAVTPVPGTRNSIALETSPHTSPSWVPPMALGSMTVTVQLESVDV